MANKLWCMSPSYLTKVIAKCYPRSCELLITGAIINLEESWNLQVVVYYLDKQRKKQKSSIPTIQKPIARIQTCFVGFSFPQLIFIVISCKTLLIFTNLCKDVTNNQPLFSWCFRRLFNFFFVVLFKCALPIRVFVIRRHLFPNLFDLASTLELFFIPYYLPWP